MPATVLSRSDCGWAEASLSSLSVIAYLSEPPIVRSQQTKNPPTLVRAAAAHPCPSEIIMRKYLLYGIFNCQGAQNTL